jgi:YesN/AraC family two-component response regulator
VDVETAPGMKVLIVDDSADLRMLLSRVIERRSAGWQVVAQAVDGRQAIDAATAHEVDLVLLDIAMPVMDGMEALPHIREAAPDAVVVMLSGFPFAVAGQGALDAGADGYLEKTDLVKGLVPRLEKIILGARATGTPQN